MSCYPHLSAGVAIGIDLSILKNSLRFVSYLLLHVPCLFLYISLLLLATFFFLFFLVKIDLNMKSFRNLDLILSYLIFLLAYIHTHAFSTQIKFSSVPDRSTLSAMIKQLKLSDRPLHALRKMEAGDVPAVHTLLCQSLAK